MNILLLCIILCALSVRCENSTREECMDPNDEEDNVELWKYLFIKLNTVLEETEKISQNQLDVNKRLDNITKRLEGQEVRLTKLIDDVQEIRVEEKNGQQEQEKRHKKLIEDFQVFKESGDRQEKRLTEIVKSVQEINTTEKKSQSWTIVIRRKSNSVDFHRSWNDYKAGFGNPDGDYFIGLERLHQITTNDGPQELLITITDFRNKSRIAKYDAFRIGNEREKYAIMELGAYTGDAGDGLAHHRGQPFSTYDSDNNRGERRDCPKFYSSGWWYHDPCYTGNLNGLYRQAEDHEIWGVSWKWQGWNVSMKYAAMMIRPKL